MLKSLVFARKRVRIERIGEIILIIIIIIN